MRRNELFSLEENTDEVTKRIEEQEQEVSTTKKEFLEMLEKIMEDFKDQKGRQLLNLRHLRV
jgi:F0F1-type ATP synthase membrane subunit b/b'